jgi:ADP-ribosylglycohydrolase
MNDNAKAMVLASFIGDSLSLGVHWIYNTHVIDKKYGRVTDMMAPKLASFHHGKSQGDFTHYGDQTLLLMESIVSGNGFDPDRFANDWRTFMKTYDGYIDQATKTTLENFKAGKNAETAGSESDDLGGPARMAPLIYLYRNDPVGLMEAVKRQTRMTHNGPEIVETAEFFARTVLSVLNGDPPRTAMKKVMDAYFNRSPFNEWVSRGMDTDTLDSRAAIKDFGQMCEVQAAFPATVHLIAKYQDHFEQALIENIMAGGDSAARGMITGMVLGAYHGMDQIPERWLNGVVAHDQIVQLLNKIDLVTQ